MSVVPDEAESNKLESPSMVTGFRQSQGNRIIATDCPFSAPVTVAGRLLKKVQVQGARRSGE